MDSRVRHGRQPESMKPAANFTEMLGYRPMTDLKAFYRVVIPIMIALCFVAFIGNAYVMASIPFIRRHVMTVNLRLSLSLSCADAWAALLILCGLIVNSYIPAVHEVTLGQWTACYFLVLELLRVAGLITSVLHLLALAANHWLNIVAPLKYKNLITTRVCRTIMFTLWVLPLTSAFAYASALPREGFRHRLCVYGFYYRFTFRLTVFTVFAVPFPLMTVIYGDILRRLVAARRRRSSLTDYRQQRRERLPEQRKAFLRMDSGASLVSNAKAVSTTLLIVGTFAVGWLPAVFTFLIVCEDCAIRSERGNLVVNVIVNSLMLGKLLLNPCIYGVRISGVRDAMWAMRVSRLGTRPLPVHRREVEQIFGRQKSRLR